MMLLNSVLVAVALSAAASALPAEKAARSISIPLDKRLATTNPDGNVDISFLRNQVASAVA